MFKIDEVREKHTDLLPYGKLVKSEKLISNQH